MDGDSSQSDVDGIAEVPGSGIPQINLTPDAGGIGGINAFQTSSPFAGLSLPSLGTYVAGLPLWAWIIGGVVLLKVIRR